jgi:hypothetical protein
MVGRLAGLACVLWSALVAPTLTHRRVFATVREVLPTHHLVLAGRGGYQAERIFTEAGRLDLSVYRELLDTKP